MFHIIKHPLHGVFAIVGDSYNFAKTTDKTYEYEPKKENL